MHVLYNSQINGDLHNKLGLRQHMGTYTTNGDLHNNWGLTQQMGTYRTNGDLHNKWGPAQKIGAYTTMRSSKSYVLNITTKVSTLY